MTAWTVVAVNLCVLTKCGVNFLALEYGSQFQLISDDYLLCGCVVMCTYALFVDTVNLLRYSGGQ